MIHIGSAYWSIIYGSAAIYIVLLLSSIFIHDKSQPLLSEIFFSFITISFGAALAWFLAIIVSPYEGESARFTSISSGLLGIATGYLAGKSDKLIDRIFDPNFVSIALGNRIVIFRLISFLISLVITFVVAYSVRVYVV
jgi:hypothetical protein